MTVWESRFAVWLTAVGTIKGRDNDKNIQKLTRFMASPKVSVAEYEQNFSDRQLHPFGGGELVSHIFQSVIIFFS
jgi:ABC-type Fe3+ transport system substrate-binding protein